MSISLFIFTDMNISMSVSSNLLLFCGVGYFKGLKHSIFKSCHQIPTTSVLATWCMSTFYCTLSI